MHRDIELNRIVDMIIVIENCETSADSHPNPPDTNLVCNFITQNSTHVNPDRSHKSPALHFLGWENGRVGLTTD